MCSPGPIYNVPSTVGESDSYTFGAAGKSKETEAKYPDASLDLMQAEVDSQKMRYPSVPRVRFGTEQRMCQKNGEIIDIHPGLVLGKDAPGSMEYTPRDEYAAPCPPKFSIGPASARLGEKHPPRIPMPYSATPRHTGPGSHPTESAFGTQPRSTRSSARASSFGSERRMPANDRSTGMLVAPSDLSSLGRQVLSSARTAASSSFGTATRDQIDRTVRNQMHMDKGPVANMPKPRFHLDLPKAERMTPRFVGM